MGTCDALRSRSTHFSPSYRPLQVIAVVVMLWPWGAAEAQSSRDIEDEDEIGINAHSSEGTSHRSTRSRERRSWWEEDQGSGRGQFDRWDEREAPRRQRHARSVVEADGPWAFGGSAALGIGFFFSTYGKWLLFVGRQFWNRLDLELNTQLMIGRDLVGLEGNARLGVLLHVSPRWDVNIFWRLGFAAFRIVLPIDTIWTMSLAMAVGVELRVTLRPRLELRFTPLAAAGFWNQVWGFTVEPAVGVAYRF